jgi:hypothetical protein
MIATRSSIVAVKETVFSDLGGEIALLNMRSGEYFGLNEVGAFIWSLIQEPRTVEEICSAVEREFDVTHDRCAHDLGVLIGELEANRLVAVAEGA